MSDIRWWNVLCAYIKEWIPNSGGCGWGAGAGNESVWWSIIVVTVAVGNDSAQKSTIIVTEGNNRVSWVMMYAGALS